MIAIYSFLLNLRKEKPAENSTGLHSYIIAELQIFSKI
nr:MAG TPA: hypothetical protein [Caudoviricetes sp.]